METKNFRKYSMSEFRIFSCISIGEEGWISLEKKDLRILKLLSFVLRFCVKEISKLRIYLDGSRISRREGKITTDSRMLRIRKNRELMKIFKISLVQELIRRNAVSVISVSCH